MMTSSELAYSREIAAVFPRVLASFDDNSLSRTSGLADRLFWSWKLTDFPNATLQSMVHGLATLAAQDRLPWGVDPRRILTRIDAAIDACKKIMAREGSLSEAFPNEKSFCVTAQVAFDILCAADMLRPRVSSGTIARWHSVAAPMIEFIKSHDETHALISNHLATASAALFRWAENGDAAAATRARSLLEDILSHQSSEGWFSEYGGFDPGYETLGLYYLADIHTRRAEPKLAAALGQSLELLRFAAHPDGSFGGLYGARNTRFIVPAGFEMLAGEFPAAAELAQFARTAIEKRSTVVLSAMDDGNLAPMFNSYCRALAAAAPIVAGRSLPAETAGAWRRSFPDAGLIIDKGPHHYTIVSTLKGGVTYHFQNAKTRVDPGRVARRGSVLYTSQSANKKNEIQVTADGLIITAPFTRAIAETLTPLKLILLRVLCLTVFRSRPIGEAVKRMLVRRLITGQHDSGVSNRRFIRWGEALTITDEMVGSSLEPVEPAGPFRAIHMASSGYWQIGDDKT